MAEQLLFNLPVRVARGRSDFIVSPCNALAVDLIDSWPAWPGVAACLVGPARSGKTHLVEVWREQSGAVVIDGAALDEAQLEPLLAAPAVAIDNADKIADEAALFHLFNALKSAEGHLLMTATKPPARWGLELPDLQSRLVTAALAELAPPDDALLTGLFTKLFQDRQMDVKEDVISFIIKRVERSFEAAIELAEVLDREALRDGRAISIPLVRRILDRGE